MKNKFSAIILAPEPNPNLVKTSLFSLKRHIENIVVSVPGNTDKELIKTLSVIAPVVQGGNTITSLINAAFQNANEWQVTLMAGVAIADGLTRKFNLFIEDTKDILFTVVPEIDRQGKIAHLNNTFSTCTLNGIAIHAQTFQKVGPFADEENLQYSRLAWASDAMGGGCRFKGIMGLKMA